MKKVEKILLGLVFTILFFVGGSMNILADDSSTQDDIPDAEIIVPGDGFTPIIGQQPTPRRAGYNPGTLSVVTYGPYYYSVKGSSLQSWIAKYSPASLNLDAASRRAVLNKYGSISNGKTYKIRWYNQVKVGLTSANGSIIKYSCVN